MAGDQRKQATGNASERRIAAAGLHPHIEYSAKTLLAARQCLIDMATECGKSIDALTSEDIANAFVASRQRFNTGPCASSSK